MPLIYCKPEVHLTEEQQVVIRHLMLGQFEILPDNNGQLVCYTGLYYDNDHCLTDLQPDSVSP